MDCFESKRLGSHAGSGAGRVRLRIVPGADWSETGRRETFEGFGSAAVLEVVEDWRGDTYRAVYTVRYAHAVYVLHCFQKKSAKGTQTPKPDMTLIRDRLKAVDELARGITK